jgi:hypothetical protein
MAFANEFPQGQPDMPRAVRVATPSDVADLDSPGRAIMLPVVGAVRMTDLAGNVITFASGELAALTQYYMPIRKIHDTGTDSAIKIFVWQDK